VTIKEIVLHRLPDPVVDVLRYLVRALRVINVWISTFWWTLVDNLRYLRHQGERAKGLTKQQAIAHITKTYHSLEKGLSLRDVRPGFGLPQALRLAQLLENFGADHGVDRTFRAALDALDHYLRFQSGVGHELPVLKGRAAALRALVEKAGQEPGNTPGGVESISSSEMFRISGADFEKFLKNRHSIRHFDAAPLDEAALLEACKLAQLAPSACNRQAGRAHCFTSPEMVRRVLSVQPGNRGFGHTATGAIVITANLESFAGPGERHQAIVDGSLFAMTFVYALHSLGLGSCMLAWAVSPGKDREMREVARIPDNEQIVVVIAAGHLPGSLRVPASVRIDVGQFAQVQTTDTSAG